MPDDGHTPDHPEHELDDALDDALDRALREALGPDGPWDDDFDWPDDHDAGAARTAVVHGVRRRRARRLQAVTAVAALVVVVGLVVSQVVATTAPSTGGSRTKGRSASAAAATRAQCRPVGAALHSCGTFTGALKFSALASGAAAAPTSAGPVRHDPELPTMRVLHATVGKPISVVLPVTVVSLWERPSVTTAGVVTGSAPVVGVVAAPATSVRDVHGWDRFVLEPEHVGAATVEATGTCPATSSSASCNGGRTYWVLEVEVAGT